MWSLVWCHFKWSVDQRSTLEQAIWVCRTQWYNPLYQHLLSGGGVIASVEIFFRWATNFITITWMGPEHLHRAQGRPGFSGMTSFTFGPGWSLCNSVRVFLIDPQPIADLLCSLFYSDLINGVVHDIQNTSTFYFFFSFGTGYTHFIYPWLNGYASKRARFKSIHTSEGTIAPSDLMACPHIPISLKAQRWAWQQSLCIWPQQEALDMPVMLFHLHWYEYSRSFTCFASHGTVISTMKSDFCEVDLQDHDREAKMRFWSRSTCILQTQELTRNIQLHKGQDRMSRHRFIKPILKVLAHSFLQ